MIGPTPSCGHQARPKKIIVCCDGTWENSLDTDSTPLSNVTKISRSLRRTCEDGTSQVVYYHPGVGTGGLLLNTITGGAFGVGLAEVCHIFLPIVLLPNQNMGTDDLLCEGHTRSVQFRLRELCRRRRHHPSWILSRRFHGPIDSRSHRFHRSAYCRRHDVVSLHL